MQADFPLRRIVSGGQTGVDRAALDAALFAEIACGGWCPKGRLSEDGCIDPLYPLEETPTADYAERTRWNARDSDGTLILVQGNATGGTAFTVDCARILKRPYLIADPEITPIDTIREWIQQEGIRTLNIAGPRESSSPGIYSKARCCLDKLLAGTQPPDTANF